MEQRMSPLLCLSPLSASISELLQQCIRISATEEQGGDDDEIDYPRVGRDR
jgi:hypothetical protein